MKILMSHKPEFRISGGWTFQSNFINGMKRYFPDVDLVYDENEEHDIYFMPMVTSVIDDKVIEREKDKGKKIVIRLGNMPKPSRNSRQRIFNKIKKYTTLADQVIYQSKWAKTHIAWGEIPSNGIVITNGVNQDIFNTNGGVRDFTGGKKYKGVYLILISSSDPCKRLHESLHIFEQTHKRTIEESFDPVKLIIAGRLPDEYHVRKMESNWDFVRGEENEYIGELHSAEEVAKVMRGCTHLLFPSYNDAAPNTVLEARACGLDVIYSQTGGTPQVASLEGYKMGLNVMVENYFKCFENVLKKQW